MRITVRANHPTHSQLARAGRFWPVKEALEVEVLDTEEDPPPIVVKVKNPTTLAMQDKERPNPTVIGRATLRILQADTRLSIQQLDSISTALAERAVQAATEEVGRVSGELLAAKTEVASLTSQLEDQGKELVGARARIAELEAEATAAAVKAGAEAEADEKADKGHHTKGHRSGGK